MSNEAVSEAARLLREAEATTTPCAPVRELLGTDDVDAAYAVQAANLELAVAGGRRVVGRKIGLTNPVVQQQLGVDQPDFGTLFADMGVADGVTIDSARVIQPRAEAEIALVLGSDLDRTDNAVLDVLAAVDHALPALEIVDSRITDWDIGIVDTVADNGSSALFVVGSSPRRLAEFDIRAVPMTMTVNGEAASRGAGSSCLENPLEATIWLANTLAGLGTPLRAGDLVLTGALGPMVAVGPGDEVSADLGPLGTVTTRFSARG
jgi:2-keto-4-pentenoate hydratase